MRQQGEALCQAPRDFFERHPVTAQVVLASIRDASDVLAVLLERGSSVWSPDLVERVRHGGWDPRQSQRDETSRTLSLRVATTERSSE